MRWSDIRDIDRETVSDFVWKWRCKIFPAKDTAVSTSLDEKNDDATAATATGDESKNNGKDASFGTDLSIKTMFEGRNSNSHDYDWVDYPPSSSPNPQLVPRTVYPLKYHKIEVQNPALVAALEPILKKEDVHLDVNETASFESPFRGLWFCQDDIIALYKKTPSSDQLHSYLKLLVRVMDEMFGEMRIKKKNLQASGLIDYKTAWTLFPRGSTVYSFGINSEFLCKVESTSYVRKEKGNFLLVKVKVLKFNGEQFVWHNETLPIPMFEGNKPIRELEHFPLEFHPDPEGIRRRLIARGRKVLDLQGLQYRCYNGIALHYNEDCEIERHNVQGRVLIDVAGYNKYHLARGRRENEDPAVKRMGFGLFDSDSDGDSDNDSDDGSFNEAALRKNGGKKFGDDDFLKNKQMMSSREEELCFITGLMGGYALKNKLWVNFYVEDVEPMVWNDTAYSHLVYDDQQKDLVLSFVQNHNCKRNASQALTPSSGSTAAGDAAPAPMEDVIVGKGQGLIILLSGPPGTGKTLTAEAVADRTHRPLFYLQAEDLGINAAALGANIKRVFEMATDWDAVVLLDEADVFMAERNPNDIQRNELVSIFLRELEYFRGIIFLTTNLYHTIDPAFRSRVSLHLLFQALTRDAREAIWRKFLERLPEIQEIKSSGEQGEEGPAEPKGKEVERPLDDGDLRELSLWQLNGREIKNAVKMVRSWCEQKGYPISLQRMENGIKVTSPHATKEGDVDADLYE
ncbi:hypothetical protein PT974_02052 [Cladobotryum mycophilum]|uniref:AAA+ ATPase domain-containing protein n=1 Tax=Cladobotryum mycophilum TaxID=491253 RepID=A0ABR0SX89_9HYPO